MKTDPHRKCVYPGGLGCLCVSANVAWARAKIGVTTVPILTLLTWLRGGHVATTLHFKRPLHMHFIAAGSFDSKNSSRKILKHFISRWIYQSKGHSGASAPHRTTIPMFRHYLSYFGRLHSCWTFIVRVIMALYLSVQEGKNLALVTSPTFLTLSRKIKYISLILTNKLYFADILIWLF